MPDDDAGGGRRGRRAALTPTLAAALAEGWGIDARTAEDLGGSSSLNLRVADRVARIYRPYVTAERVDSLQALRALAHDAGVPCATPLADRNGALWQMIDGRVVEVERFVPHDGKMDTLERVALGLPFLARLHSAFAGIEVHPDAADPPFANHIHADATVAGVAQARERVGRWDPTAAERDMVDQAMRLAETVAEAEAPLLPHLRPQPVHGDFWDNNVLFRGDAVAHIADFDFSGVRPRTDDLALTLYFSLVGKRADDATLRRLIDAYDTHLDERLTEAEREILPWTIARQPLWWVGRWLPLLDDDGEARAGLAGMAEELAWAQGWIAALQSSRGRSASRTRTQIRSA